MPGHAGYGSGVMGVLHGWRVCPRCGHELTVAHGCAECPECGSTYYANAAPTASALILDGEGRLLLARRAYDPYKGMWDTVGGFLGENEHPDVGLRREAAEETGLDVEPGEYVGTYLDRYGEGEAVVATMNLVFEAAVTGGELEPADDVAELHWVALDELPPPGEFAFHDVGRFVHEWAAGRRKAARQQDLPGA